MVEQTSFHLADLIKDRNVVLAFDVKKIDQEGVSVFVLVCVCVCVIIIIIIIINGLILIYFTL